MATICSAEVRPAFLTPLGSEVVLPATVLAEAVVPAGTVLLDMVPDRRLAGRIRKRLEAEGVVTPEDVAKLDAALRPAVTSHALPGGDVLFDCAFSRSRP